MLFPFESHYKNNLFLGNANQYNLPPLNKRCNSLILFIIEKVKTTSSAQLCIKVPVLRLWARAHRVIVKRQSCVVGHLYQTQSRDMSLVFSREKQYKHVLAYTTCLYGCNLRRAVQGSEIELAARGSAFVWGLFLTVTKITKLMCSQAKSNQNAVSLKISILPSSQLSDTL